MAWVGEHRKRGAPSQERAHRARRAETVAERRTRLIREGRCVRCAEANDRKGTVSKNGRRAVVCSRCLERAAAEAATVRETSKRAIMEMERALGMPVLGVGGKGVR